MKKFTLVSLYLLIVVTAFSQVTLSYENNALISGDSISFREIAFIEPGDSGAGQVWDFSKIQFTGNNPVGYLPASPTRKIMDESSFNLLLNEFGYEYYFNLSQTQLEEVAITIQGISLVYSDPILKMKYPFAYGQNFTDNFAGVATYPDNRTMEISGNYTVIADAFGTLILPDGIYKNALRIRIEKNGVQLNQCGTTTSNSIRYLWYAPGIRYPLLSGNTTAIKSNGGEPRITRTAFVNQQKNNSESSVSGVNIPAAKGYADVSAVVYPSPFKRTLNYQYFLPQKMPVSIDLYTMDGKKNISLVKNQIQPEGLHAGEVDASVYVLTPGVYFLRFTFEKKVIVSKVVKMQ